VDVAPVSDAQIQGRSNGVAAMQLGLTTFWALGTATACGPTSIGRLLRCAPHVSLRGQWTPAKARRSATLGTWAGGGSEGRFVQLQRLKIGGVSAALVAVTLAGCGGSTKTVIETPSTPTSSGNPPASSTPTDSTPTESTPTAFPQIFHGNGQQNLGTINVSADTTISWNCPSCGDTNFIINNAKSDPNEIVTNGLDQTQGVDPLPAGVYHTVVVDTTGGPWTVAIGTTAPPPNGSSSTPSPSAPAQGTTQCDPNVSVSGTDCGFAQNTFYEYWKHGGTTTFSVYDPSAGTSYSVSCSVSGQISCSTDQGATVTFAQSAISAYSQGQADAYAKSHDLGP
jgi:hypothetical protein